MRKTTSVCEVLLGLSLCAALCAPAVAQSAPKLGLSEVVSRMQAAENAVQTRPAYTLLREYRISGADPNAASSQVLAEVNYFPPADKQFAIKQRQGNERGEKIVRRVLEHEVKMSRDSAASSFSTENYDFALLGSETRNSKQCYVLQLFPKHASTELLRGKAWVDPDTFLIVRVEGEPAKSPSWWVRDLRVAIDYGRADSIWLPLTSQATADLRLLGTHVMTAKDVQVRAATVDANVKTPAALPRHRSKSRGALADTAIWVPQ